MPTSVPNFNFLSLLVSEMKRVSWNLMWGYKQHAKFQHRISMHHAIMRLRISHRLTVICTKNGVLGGVWGWRCENIALWPPRGTTLREYASVGVSRVKIGSTAWVLGPWKDFAYKERKKNKNLAIARQLRTQYAEGIYRHKYYNAWPWNIAWVSPKVTGNGTIG